MDLELAGRTVLVTGASGGIGRGLVQVFTAEGANVVLASRDEAKSREVAASSAGPGDTLVVGCAQAIAPDAAGPSPGAGRVAVATSRMALCRVDASFGAIAVGDRLTSSPSPGVAMKADLGVEGPALLGRAIDPLPTGSGLIRVLLGGR